MHKDRWYRHHPLALALPLTFSLLLGGLCQSAHAQADRKVAMELVRMVTPQEIYAAMLDQITKQMLASMRQSGATLPPDVETKMKKVVGEVLPYDELAGWSADVYSARFSNEELRQLMAFYKTPVGAKVAKLQPEISGEVGKKMGPLMMQRMPAALKRAGLAP